MARGVAAALLSLLLIACGGGGTDPASGGGQGNGGADGGTSSGSSGSTASSSDTTCGNANLPSELLSALNAVRANARTCGARGNFAAAPALAWHASLFDAAAAHSSDMVAQGYFAHVGPSGQTLQDRIDATGYRWNALAENIAYGQTSVASVLNAWLASDGHCANLMGSIYQHVALACVRNTSGVRYWTLDLARPAS